MLSKSSSVRHIKGEASPIIAADGEFDLVTIADRLKKQSPQIDRGIADCVYKKIMNTQ
jgi:hypothetical protein